MTRASLIRGLQGLLLPALLVLLTVALRLYGISDNSITQDESTMVLFAHGVLERGYPFLRQAHSEFIISTYELVPYPIALSIGLFGMSELGARLPAVCFAAGTCLLILNFATTLFDRRTGVLAALLFAVLPWATYWGSNAFYPSQLAFFALLSTMAVHGLIVEDEPRPWRFYSLLACFTATYLTWEGSAAVLPAFFVMLLAFRWGRWQWLKGPHAWTVAAGIIFVVVGQLTWRTVLRQPFLGVVTGRSDVSFAKLAFTGTGFDPLYYVGGLFSEAHLVIAACLLAGLLLLRASSGLRFLYLFLGLYLLVLTSLLGYYALRYVYLTLPAFVMLAAAVSVQLADCVSAGSRLASATALAGLTALHLVFGTAWSLQPVELSRDLVTTARPNEMRRDLPGFSFRSTAKVLMDAYRPGDTVIVQAPFPFAVYTGMRGDYFLQSVTASSVYFEKGALPYYTDKWMANPVLRNQEELDEVLARHDRVWFVSAPDGASTLSVGLPLYDSLVRRLQLFAETGDGRLYLWVNPRVRMLKDGELAP